MFSSNSASSPEPTPQTSPRHQRVTSDEDNDIKANREAFFNRNKKKK
jgi:hypothetical protein